MFAGSWAIPINAEKPEDGRLRKDYSNDEKVKPIIKWAGGKSQLMEQIRRAYPMGLGDSITRYAEPFIGGAAVLLDVLSSKSIEEAYISDVNRELVCLYQTVRDDAGDLIGQLKEYQDEHLALDMDGRKQYFYEKRDRYNEVKASDNLDKIECSALFIYLNKTCFNGLYRVNSRGEFNVPSGVYKNPTICDEGNIRKVSTLLQNVTIECADYHESETFIDASTFVYFDPPYRPLNVTSSFTSYTEGQFDDDDQRCLAEYVHSLSTKRVKVMVSNSDPKNTNPDDDFFDNLYEGLKIHRVSANRMINSKGSGRGKINELLITNYPVDLTGDNIQMGLEQFD